MQLTSRKARAKAESQDESGALHDALSDLVRVYQFRDRDTICCHDVSVTQCYALEAVVLHGPMRLNALAERLLLDKSTASRVVDALERKGYLARLADAADARATLLRVTAKGQKLHDRIRGDLISEHEATIADLSRDARRAAIEVITRLARAAEKRFGCGSSTGCAPACGTKAK